MSIVQDLEHTVDELVRRHFEVREDLERIIWFHDPEGREIRFIEVSNNTFETGAVQVFSFGRTSEIQFPVRIADLTTGEWQRVLAGEIPLPKGWDMQSSKEFTRENVRGHSASKD